MLYLANPNKYVAEYMQAGTIGFIDTPRQGNVRPAGVTWCADNGCFSGKGFDEGHWWRWLEKQAFAADTCLFATAPDVVGDAAATLERSRPWLPKIRALGYPAALVAQDGLEHLDVPWDEFDCLFIGGTTDWKMSAPVRALVTEANERGKHTHFGRVNSNKRFQYAASMCDSADGTYLVFGPRENLPKLLSWIRQAEESLSLF